MEADFSSVYSIIYALRGNTSNSQPFLSTFYYFVAQARRRIANAADAPSEPPPRRADARRPLIIFLIFKLGRGGANRRANFSGNAPSFSANSPQPALSAVSSKKKRFKI